MFDCTMVLPYYQAGKLLKWNLELWASYPDDIKKHIRYIIVDDGSPTDKAIKYLDKRKLRKKGIPLELYEVTENKMWNSEGANNLGIQQVKTDRFLRMDFDYHFPAEELRKILSIDLRQNQWYNFNVIQYKTHKQLISHVNTFLMMKESFWKSGGYDEDFCGNYGWTDLLLERTFAKYAKQFIRKDINLVTCPYESTHGLERDGSINEKLLYEKTKILFNQTDFSKDIIRFPWRKVEL